VSAFTPHPVKPAISIEALDQIDIRVGTIERVEDVAGSSKLVKMTVDFGDHKRTILAGMKQERAEPKSEQDQAKDLERRHGRSARERERIVGSRDL